MSTKLELRFSGAHADAPELPGDLDVLYRFVADEFEVRLDGMPIYREVEFPIVELAQTLRSWLGEGLEARRGFVFTPSGGSEVALGLEPLGPRWLVRPEGGAPVPVSDDELTRSVRQFVDDVLAAGGRANVDVTGALQRLGQRANG